MSDARERVQSCFVYHVSPPDGSEPTRCRPRCYGHYRINALAIMTGAADGYDGFELRSVEIPGRRSTSALRESAGNSSGR